MLAVSFPLAVAAGLFVPATAVFLQCHSFGRRARVVRSGRDGTTGRLRTRKRERAKARKKREWGRLDQEARKPGRREVGSSGFLAS
jgi:hypothetical protein